MSIIIDESNEKNNGVNSGLPASRDINTSIRIYQQIYQHITGTTETALLQIVGGDKLIIPFC
ncbi:hypothetical protein [Escherichia coli]|uniref:hypothetical protein n=1 Tax=Escherichia coli TaxID=562 RepID=UPI0012FFE6F0|nr:hypothetical protein [Escherichia coli]